MLFVLFQHPYFSFGCILNTYRRIQYNFRAPIHQLHRMFQIKLSLHHRHYCHIFCLRVFFFARHFLLLFLHLVFLFRNLVFFFLSLVYFCTSFLAILSILAFFVPFLHFPFSMYSFDVRSVPTCLARLCTSITFCETGDSNKIRVGVKSDK